jgi:hypothetical protein
MQLKREIDLLEEQHLELVYNFLRQFLPSLNTTRLSSQKPSLLSVLATLEEIDEEFPEVDENLLPLDDIRL